MKANAEFRLTGRTKGKINKWSIAIAFSLPWFGFNYKNQLDASYRDDWPSRWIIINAGLIGLRVNLIGASKRSLDPTYKPKGLNFGNVSESPS